MTEWQREPKTVAITATVHENARMPRKHPARPVSDQLRAAIRNSPMSQMAIGETIGLNKAPLSRFMNEKAGLRLETVDKLCDLLGLKLVAKQRRTRR